MEARIGRTTPVRGLAATLLLVSAFALTACESDADRRVDQH